MIKKIDNVVEVWIHDDDAELFDDAACYSFDDGYYEERDWLLHDKNRYVAKLTLDKEEVEKLIEVFDFTKSTYEQAMTSLSEVKMSSMRFSMIGHIASACDMDKPWSYKENRVGNKFMISSSLLEVFSDGTVMILLYTDDSDSFIKLDITRDIDKLREFKEV